MARDYIYKNIDDEIPFRKLSKKLEEQIKHNQSIGWKNDHAFKDEDIVRRIDKDHDRATILRPAFDRDIEKIMYLPPYNRYNDKTQVFSFLRNDDVSRRGLHVQYVSKIARNIGELLGLNVKLIEAMALGHDIGHTPFGHAGEKFINQVYHDHTGRYFNHNVHSVRVLDVLYKRNLSMQTLDGILCHNGEIAKQVQDTEYLENFEQFDNKTENCYVDKNAVKNLIPGTLEACVVRIADIIAYLGKDRIDALQIGALHDSDKFDSKYLGRTNTKIINNLIVDIVENSYGKNHIIISEDIFDDLVVAKEQNYKMIYNKEGMNYDDILKLQEMINLLFDKFYADLLKGDETSSIFKHHIKALTRNSSNVSVDEYLQEDPNQIVIDYLASMTDTYFMTVYQKYFPEDKKNILFRGYFQLNQ